VELNFDVASVGGTSSISRNTQTDASNASIRWLFRSPNVKWREAVKWTIYELKPCWVDSPPASLEAQRLVEIDDSGNYHVARRDIFD